MLRNGHQASVYFTDTQLGNEYMYTLVSEAGSGLNIKTAFPRYGYFHVKDKTVARPSYL